MSTHSEFVTRSPAPPLAPLIESYHGYRMQGFAAGVHRGLPSRSVTFIVAIGPAIDVVAQSDRTQAPQAYRCVLSGLQATSALIAHDGNQEGVAIELTPLGFRTLFAMPVRELWNTSVELDEVVRNVGTELWERLQGTSTWAARFTACDEVLLRLLRDDAASLTLGHAWSVLVGSGGTVAIDELATTVGWSRQHLARRFQDEFGLGPKLAGRVVRFERARRMLQAHAGRVPIARIAATCGYYDQAHLDRDFAELAGCTPTQLLAEEELPTFQDPDAVVA